MRLSPTPGGASSSDAFTVLAADRPAGQDLHSGHVEEAKRGGGGYDLDGPAVFLGELDELADLGGRPSSADDDGQDAAVAAHSVTRPDGRGPRRGAER
jgi:hypothetical protein